MFWVLSKAGEVPTVVEFGTCQERVTFSHVLHPVVGKTTVIISPLLKEQRSSIYKTPLPFLSVFFPSVLAATRILWFGRHTGTNLPQGFCACCSLCLECSSSTCLHGLPSYFQNFTPDQKDFDEAFPDDYLKSKPSQHTGYYLVPFLAVFLFFAPITFFNGFY